MNNRDIKIIIGELRLQAWLAFLMFFFIFLFIAVVTSLMIIWGNPSTGIIKRACFATIIVLIFDVVIFRKTFLLVIDLIRKQKVIVYYEGIDRKLDKSEFINLTELLSKLSESGNFEKLDFNQSFIVELSKTRKEILYIEQHGKVIFPIKTSE